LAQRFVFLLRLISHLFYGLYEIKLEVFFLAKLSANVGVLLEEEGGIEQFAVGALGKLSAHALLHMQRKHTEIHHLAALGAGNQVGGVGLECRLFDRAFAKLFTASPAVNVKALRQDISST
jgi:hypothetical protein